jgi:hypothetical protein
LGQQRIAWGGSEFFQPNDVINARDLRDPFLNDTELLRIPLLLARVDVDILKRARLQLIFAPFFVPDRIAFYGENWAFIQPGAPAPLRMAMSWLSNSQDTRVQAALLPLTQLGQPRTSFSDASVGGRLASSLGRFDLALYYHYGLLGLPTILVDPQLQQALSTVNLSTINQAEFNSAILSLPQLQNQLTYQRRHHVGFDIGTTVGPVGLHLDLAYDSQRMYYDVNFAGLLAGTFESVLSVEYQTGDPSKIIMLELDYQRITDDIGGASLLFYNVDTVAAGALLRWTFFRRLELELRSLLGVTPFSYVLRPQVGVKIQDWAIQLGGLIMGGDEYSTGGYFQRNQSLYLNIKGFLR